MLRSIHVRFGFYFCFFLGKALRFYQISREVHNTPKSRLTKLSGQRLWGFATKAGPPDQDLQHHFIKPLKPQPSGAWVARLVRGLPWAWVMIPGDLGSSLLLPLTPSHALSLSFYRSQINKIVRKKQQPPTPLPPVLLDQSTV